MLAYMINGLFEGEMTSGMLKISEYTLWDFSNNESVKKTFDVGAFICQYKIDLDIETI